MNQMSVLSALRKQILVKSDVDNIEPVDPVEPADPCKRMQKLTGGAFKSDASHQQLSLLCQGLVSAHPECFWRLHRDAQTCFKTTRGKLQTRDMGALKLINPRAIPSD